MSSVMLCTASYDRTIRFWEATTGVSYHTIQYTDSQFNAIQLTSTKEYLACGGNRHIRIFHINTDRQVPLVSSLDGHRRNVLTLTFDEQDEFLVSGSEDKTIKVWDLRMSRFVKSFDTTAPVNHVALHPNQGEFVSGDEGGNVIVWDLVADRSRECVRVPERTAVRCISMSRDENRCALCCNNGEVYIYDYDSGRAPVLEFLTKFQAHNRYVLKCQFSPNGRTLATCASDQTIRLYSAEEDEFKWLKTLRGHKAWVWDMQFSSDSAYLVSCSSDETAKLWDLDRGESIKTYKGHQKSIVSIALNDKTT